MVAVIVLQMTSTMNIQLWCMKNALESKLSLSHGICFIFMTEPKCARGDSWKYFMMKNGFVFCWKSFKECSSKCGFFIFRFFLPYIPVLKLLLAEYPLTERQNGTVPCDYWKSSVLCEPLPCCRLAAPVKPRAYFFHST